MIHASEELAAAIALVIVDYNKDIYQSRRKIKEESGSLEVLKTTLTFAISDNES